MKPYPPTLKSKKRYVLFEVVSDKKFGKEDVKKAIWSILHDNIGNMGLADAEFAFIDFDEKSQKGILRCTNTRLEQVRAALALLSEINLYKAFLYIRTVAGSIKKANSRVI
jgi:ribonuclease P/MRP protein subunit POP5